VRSRRLLLGLFLSALAASAVADAFYYGYFALFGDWFFAQRVFAYWSLNVALVAVVFGGLPASLVLERFRRRGLSLRRLRITCVAVGAAVGLAVLLLSASSAGPWFALFGGPLLPASVVAGAVGGWVLAAVAWNADSTSVKNP
jgi:hypothetical protein